MGSRGLCSNGVYLQNTVTYLIGLALHSTMKYVWKPSGKKYLFDNQPTLYIWSLIAVVNKKKMTFAQLI